MIKIKQKHLELFIKNSHNMTIPEVTKKYGYSRNLLNYHAVKYGFIFKRCEKKNINRKYWPKDIEKITNFYLKNGFKKTVEKYPEFNIKSINSVYMLKKSIRYRKNGIPSFKEKLFKLKYDEFLDTEIKRKILTQSGVKRIRYSQFIVNGKEKTCFGFSFNTMAFSHVKHFLKNNVKTIFLNRTKYKEVVTWEQIAKNIVSDNHDLITIAKSMAKFQRWLHNKNIITNQEEICKKYQELKM